MENLNGLLEAVKYFADDELIAESKETPRGDVQPTREKKRAKRFPPVFEENHINTHSHENAAYPRHDGQIGRHRFCSPIFTIEDNVHDWIARVVASS